MRTSVNIKHCCAGEMLPASITIRGVENKEVAILWDMMLHTDRTNKVNKLDVVTKDKEN